MSLTNSPFWFASGATAAGGGGTVVYPYSIDQSLRFDGSSAYLNFTPSNAATDSSKMTFSTWVKTWGFGESDAYILSAGAINVDGISYVGSNTFRFIRAGVTRVAGNGLRRDPSSWYHLYVTYDADGDGYARIYVNGVLDDAASQTTDLAKLGVNGQLQRLVRKSNGSTYLNVYLAETHFVDGSIVPISTFGETVNGVWVPVETSGITYGNNGWYLNYADSSDIGKDVSGRGNHWTANNLAASDVVPDSPTNNFPTLNSLQVSSSITLAEGNLKSTTTNTASSHQAYSTMNIPTSGKWYFECYAILPRADDVEFGIAELPTPDDRNANHLTAQLYNASADACAILNNTAGNLSIRQQSGTGLLASGITGSTGDIYQIAFDCDTGKVFLGRNNVYYRVTAADGDPSTGTNPSKTITANKEYFIGLSCYGGNGAGGGIINYGQDSTFAGAISAGGNADDNGFGDFKYAPPSGFLALCSANLPEPAIGPQQASGEQADDYFETMLYTGNGAIQHIGSGGAQHPIDVTTVGNSLRFNDSDNPRLSLDPIGSPTLTTKCTISFWFKRGQLTTSQYIFTGEQSNLYYDVLYISNADKLAIVGQENASSYGYQTSSIFKDSSKWYHVVLECDSTQATGTDRYKLYVDGVQQSLTSIYGVHPQNHAWYWNKSGNSQNIGRSENYGASFDGYLAEFYFIDGQALDPTSFGQYGSNGYWIPKAVSGLTFGTNGFYLDFSDNSTANALGTDSSGNANNFSATNVATTDQMGDSPTQNFAVLDPNRVVGSPTLSEGNLKLVGSGTDYDRSYATFSLTSGKWYAEFRYLSGDNRGMFGVVREDSTSTDATNVYIGSKANQYGIDFRARAYTNSVELFDTTDFSTGDIGLLCFDIDNGKLWFGRRDISGATTIWYDSAGANNGDPSAGTNPTYTGGFAGYTWLIGCHDYNGTNIHTNFGADGSFSGGITSNGLSDANGFGDFNYIEDGFLAIVDDNIPQEGINSPDFVWIKSRSLSVDHVLQDSVRGLGSGGVAFNTLQSSGTDAEINQTDGDGLLSLDYNGFTVGYNNSNAWNASGATYAAWNWKAGGKDNTFNIDGTGYATIAASPISDGTIALTGLSANTTAGFSIVGWTGTGSTGTIAHGLSSAPEMIIVKNRDRSANWLVYHKDTTDAPNDVLFLNLTNADTDQPRFNDTTPTASVFSIGSGDSENKLNEEIIAYCFHSVDGFSKVGSYVGNGSADGSFIYTGFRPAWVMTKEASDTSSWNIYDNKRSDDNPATEQILANSSNAEGTGTDIDILSNGFKIKSTSGNINTSGNTYIYLAFAEAPFKYANAR